MAWLSHMLWMGWLACTRLTANHCSPGVRMSLDRLVTFCTETVHGASLPTRFWMAGQACRLLAILRPISSKSSTAKRVVLDWSALQDGRRGHRKAAATSAAGFI